MIPDRRQENDSETMVVSFRAPRALVKELDQIAKGDDRTRANFVVRTLSQAVSLEPAIQTIEQMLPRLLEEHQKNPDSVQSEYWRGAMGGARSVIMAFFGKRAMRWVNQRVREKTKLPIPHVVPLQSDGYRYGIDTEADLT